MIGVVLAAGQGMRLRPLTDDIPKTLAPLDDERTILDTILANLAKAGIGDVAIVTGYAAEAIERLQAQHQERHGVRLEYIRNDKLDWNNCYSLWLARADLAGGAMVVNGDTFHPVAVEERLLGARGPEVLLALDDAKELGEEEMKVTLRDGRLERIHKSLDPATAAGEYIGVTLVDADIAEALEATWRRDPGLYYEDGYQTYADGGGEVRTVSVGGLEWTEVDTHEDLMRARELACRS